MALEAFLKQNKKERKNITYIASNDFVDEKGNPVEWILRPMTSRAAEGIRKACQSYGKGGQVTVDTAKFNRMVAAYCTVEPNLNNVELQNSYEVMGAEELIMELLDNDGDYQAYVKKCLEISGYNQTNNELVVEAKN